MDATVLMAKAAAETAAVVRAVRRDQLDLPTPCPDWNVRTVLNHMTLWAAVRSELSARKLPVPEQGSPGEAHDFVAEGWPELFETHLDRAVRAWSEPAAWEGTTLFGGAPMPAGLTGELLLSELVLHGWDVAVATGQRLTCPDEVAAAAYRGVAQVAEQGRQMAAYGEPVPVAAAATPLERVLALSGRDPRWSAVSATPPAASGGR
jgi:uncharacterized protein (TIGR03086 family)